MKSLNELREHRESLAAELESCRNILENKDEYKSKWDAQREEQWQDVNADYNSTVSQIEKLETLESYSKDRETEDRDEFSQLQPRHSTARASETSTSPGDFSTAFRAWVGTGKREITDSERRAASRCNVELGSRHLDVPLSPDYGSVRRSFSESRVLDTDSPNDSITPTGFQNEWERELLYHSPIRQICRVVRTSGTGPLEWPNVDDTSNASVIATESSTVFDSNTDEKDATIANTTFGSYKFVSSMKVTSELLQDSAFPLETEIPAMLAGRMARGTNSYFTTGTGSVQPHGYMIAGTAVNGADTSTSKLVSDDIFTLFHSVDPAYRAANSVFVAHDAIWAAIRKLKDGQDQYLWQPGLTIGQPDRLIGYQCVINQDMASVESSGNDVLCFGNFDRFVIRESGSLRLIKTDDRFIDNDQVGFIAFSRVDSKLITTGQPIKFINLQ